MNKPLGTSYWSIFRISFPIMLGSAAQNVMAMIDSVFLYHLSENDFAAIGFVGVFYLMIAAIGYGFSKGGQIVVAHYYGSGEDLKIGKAFRALVTFELLLALVMFLFMQFGGYYFFSLMVNSDIIFYKSLEYLEYRSWGVFPAYVGVSFIALYTGIARPQFIIYGALITVIANIILCYGLVFGHWGLPAMGIAGAGLSSTIGEYIGTFAFFVYILFDKKIRPFRLLTTEPIDWHGIKKQFQLSLPIIVQLTIGLGSWFTFFSIVENLGERQLAITNLVRMVYLVLAIPVWGYSATVNTLVSGFIGAHKRMAVLPITWKTAKAAAFSTLILALPIVFFPEQILYPLLGKSDMSLIQEAQPIFYVLLAILMTFSFGGVFFNGLVGTGATLFGLVLQVVAVIIYLVYVYIIVEFYQGNLGWAWSAEIPYWLFMFGISWWYLKSGKWHWLKIWDQAKKTE